MNLIINPVFQQAQRGVSFNLTPSGVYTLDRWVSISDTNSRCNIKQVTNPLGCEVEFNSDGFGGIWQPIEHEQIAQAVGRSLKFSINAEKKVSGCITMKLVALAWGGAKNKPTLNPLKTFSGSLETSPGWSIIASSEHRVTTTQGRFTLNVEAVPDAANIAVMVLFEGASSDYVWISDAVFGRSSDFDGVDHTDDARRCAWFFQKYNYDMIMNCEFGVGRKDPGGFISFQFPLSYPMRGRLGGAGVGDIDVIWPVAANGFWHYGGGKFSMFPAGVTPTLTCHHRSFLLLTSPCQPGTIPDQEVTIWRHWQAQPGASITFDAELQP